MELEQQSTKVYQAGTQRLLLQSMAIQHNEILPLCCGFGYVFASEIGTN